jgi:hypothetical protein
MLAQSQAQSQTVLTFDPEALAQVLQALTPAQFKVWVASQLTDGSSSKIAQLLGLGVRYVQQCKKAILGTASVKLVDEAEKASVLLVPEPNAEERVRACARLPLEVSNYLLAFEEEHPELAAQKQAADEKLAGWAAQKRYQPLSEMPFLHKRFWGLLAEGFGPEAPQVVDELLEFVSLPPPPSHPTKVFKCWLAYLVGVARKWATDPTQREYSKSVVWQYKKSLEPKPVVEWKPPVYNARGKRIA